MIIGIILIGWFIVMIICVFGIIKAENAWRNELIIIDAICCYRLHCINNHVDAYVDYTDMREYESIAHRFWDWGYKHILPEEKFKIIEPFIVKEKK